METARRARAGAVVSIEVGEVGFGFKGLGSALGAWGTLEPLDPRALRTLNPTALNPKALKP